MIRFPVRAKNRKELERMGRPLGAATEAIPHCYYDTASYVSGTTTSLTFFTTTRDNRNLSNLSPAGQLPDPYFFEIYGFGFEPLVAPAAGVWTDYWQLVYGAGGLNAAPTFTFFLSDKEYPGPVPLSLLHATGGPVGFSDAAAAPDQYMNNSVPDGSWYIDGSIVIPPSNGFRATIAWEDALTLTADTKVRVSMWGVLHRKVL